MAPELQGSTLLFDQSTNERRQTLAHDDALVQESGGPRMFRRGTRLSTKPSWLLDPKGNRIKWMMARRRIHRRHSLVHALAAREVGSRARCLVDLLPRKRWAIGQVLLPEDGAVLLGFSSDGHYLVYYSVWEAACIVQWKRIAQSTTGDRVELDLALQLISRSVGAPNVGSSLRIWQSTDDNVVAVISTDNPIASQDTGPSYHVTLSPSPRFAELRAAARSANLAFSFALPSSTQDIEPWQLATIDNHAYLLILNMGSSIQLLVLRLAVVDATARHQPRFLSHIGFENREWFAPSEYPIDFKCDETTSGGAAPHLVELQCDRQQEFDCEAFLASFFQKYAAFRHLHLVDYDLQLVRTRLSEKSIFMTCTADLQSSLSVTSRSIEQSRLALFFSVEMFTGAYHVVRALNVPRQQPLRQMSAIFAQKFLSDLRQRAPLDPAASEWTNEPVLRHQSLTALHNPRFPISIYLK